MPSILRLYKSGHIKKLEAKGVPPTRDAEYFLFYLTKKGVKKVEKLQKENQLAIKPTTTQGELS